MKYLRADLSAISFDCLLFYKNKKIAYFFWLSKLPILDDCLIERLQYSDPSLFRGSAIAGSVLHEIKKKRAIEK